MSYLPEYFEHLVNDRGLSQNQAADRLALTQNAFASGAQRKWYFANLGKKGGPAMKKGGAKGGGGNVASVQKASASLLAYKEARSTARSATMSASAAEVAAGKASAAAEAARKHAGNQDHMKAAASHRKASDTAAVRAKGLHMDAADKHEAAAKAEKQLAKDSSSLSKGQEYTKSQYGGNIKQDRLHGSMEVQHSSASGWYVYDHATKSVVAAGLGGKDAAMAKARRASGVSKPAK